MMTTKMTENEKTSRSSNGKVTPQKASHLTPIDLLDPVFVDFETNVAGEAFLVAAHWDETLLQFILNDRLAGAAARSGIQISSPEEACRKIINASRDMNRPIATYSQHDLELLRKYAPDLDFQWIDVRWLAKKWIRKNHFERFKVNPTYNANIRKRGRATDRWRFSNIANWAGIKPPFGYAQGHTISRIEHVCSGLKRTHQSYERLTATQKRKFFVLAETQRFRCRRPGSPVQKDAGGNR